MEISEVSKYIENIREIKGSNALFDLHVHPFDVFLNDFIYARNREYCNLYSANDSPYSAPRLSERIAEDKSACRRTHLDSGLMMKVCSLNIRKAYCHTGPKAIDDQNALCFLDKVLLLPVMRTGDLDDQLALMTEMFGDDDNFLFGLCVPNAVPDDEINMYVEGAVNKYNIRAIKIHPNITGIDPALGPGRERIENMLAAARANSLPVVIHGGKSPLLEGSEAASYGTLHNLQDIDWGVTDTPVVIAHAGLYGHDFPEISEYILPMLIKMLDRNSNLFVDISGLPSEPLSLLLKSVDMDRVVFGSDAFYDAPWKVAVRLLHALKGLNTFYEESFLKITSHNPQRVIGHKNGTGGRRRLAGHHMEAGR
jgi:predicted TIM-barrel fold metal-dependent hydrolase